MNKKLNLLVVPLSLLTLSGCGIVKSMEKDLTIVYTYKNEIIKSTTVNQFKNGISPTLTEEMIPFNHEFYGWTWLNPDSIEITDEDFASKYIAYDEVIHYQAVKEYANNSVVTLAPLFINIDDIPVPDYYLAIGWYGKSSTSGLNKEIMDNWTKSLYTYLRKEGATEEDIQNIHVTEYLGDIATAGSLINKDRYNDILIGFGKNIQSTGGVEYIENIGNIPMGGKTRYITRLTEDEVAIKVFNWLQTEEGQLGLQ